MSENWEEQIDRSPLWESSLNWYDFQKDANLLQIGAGNGIVTGLFLRRCRSVTVLVFAEQEKRTLEKLYPDSTALAIILKKRGEQEDGLIGKYKYVVSLEEIEYCENPAKSLTCWFSYMNPEGVLLLGVDNRYGLRYFCGAEEKHTGLPYDGINGYLQGTERGRSFSRKELLNMIRESGIEKYKFYYPVPDLRMPQMIYTDSYQNGTDAAERLVDYDYHSYSMIGIEHRIFREMIEDGGLPFMSNSFLVEMTRFGRLSDISYAVVTTDRGKNYGMATTIHEDGTVHKRPLWAEGGKQLVSLYRNTTELEKKGVPVVPVTLQKDSIGTSLQMPFIQKESLSSVLEEFCRTDPAEFMRIFDMIFQYIQQSYSENQQSGKLYLDLAPCNAFYVRGTEENGRILFYDQEFVADSGTPEFAMYRTLKYFFASSFIARSTVSPEQMYCRYGISEDQIPEFEEQEARFIQSVRHMERTKWLFRESVPDYKAIYAKMQRMRSENKPYHTGYVPGVFDLFHTGHLRLIERCKERCEYLIVGVLTDELAAYYKGKRPVVSYEDRAAVIKGLRDVDEVIPVDFSNTDKLKAWEQLHYDCHFSGDDHVHHWDDVLKELRKRGSDMEFFPYTQGISSTQIREKMKKTDGIHERATDRDQKN